MSDDVQARAAEVIERCAKGDGSTIGATGGLWAAAALAAAGLLADPDTARLRSLGEAVDKLRESRGWLCPAIFDAIYRTAGVEQ